MAKAQRVNSGGAAPPSLPQPGQRAHLTAHTPERWLGTLPAPWECPAARAGAPTRAALQGLRAAWDWRGTEGTSPPCQQPCARLAHGHGGERSPGSGRDPPELMREAGLASQQPPGSAGIALGIKAGQEFCFPQERQLERAGTWRGRTLPRGMIALPRHLCSPRGVSWDTGTVRPRRGGACCPCSMPGAAAEPRASPGWLGLQG